MERTFLPQHSSASDREMRWLRTLGYICRHRDGFGGKVRCLRCLLLCASRASATVTQCSLLYVHGQLLFIHCSMCNCSAPKEVRQAALSTAVFLDKQNNNIQRLVLNCTSLWRETRTSLLSHFLFIWRLRLSGAAKPRPPRWQC